MWCLCHCFLCLRHILSLKEILPKIIPIVKGNILECQGGLSFSLWSVESYIYLVVCKAGALQIDQSLQPYKHGIPSTVEHPHQVELTISIELHTCWYLEYWSTFWHLCSSVNCDNWEMIGLLEAIIQELDFRGRFVSRKGYIHATFLLLDSCAQVLSLCG